MQTKQTVVDWLAKELYTKMEMKGSGEVFDEIIKQANKIFQHQIINAFDEGQEYEYQYHINNAPKFDSETYYAETYGSKGSDEHRHEHRHSVHVEISDEEIENCVGNGMHDFYKGGFIEGAKWYREQLKKKQ